MATDHNPTKIADNQMSDLEADTPETLQNDGKQSSLFENWDRIPAFLSLRESDTDDHHRA